MRQVAMRLGGGCGMRASARREDRTPVLLTDEMVLLLTRRVVGALRVG